MKHSVARSDLDWESALIDGISYRLRGETSDIQGVRLCYR